MKDYYKILGVDKAASPDDIKKAFRRLAHQYHPDRPGGNEARFKEVNEAYQILSSVDKRRQYDQFGSGAFSQGAGFNPSGFGFSQNGFGFQFDPSQFEDLGNFSDIFEGIFEGMGVKRRKTYHRGADLSASMLLTLEEVFSGTEKKLAYETYVKCGECEGAGNFAKEGFTKCEKCGGKGDIRETKSGFFGNISQIRECDRCQGTGQIPNKVCKKCSGDGRVKAKKEVLVRIVPGIHSGQIIKIAHEGEAGARGAEAGDLYVKIDLISHARFSVEGDDLRVKVPVSILDILLKKELLIETLDKKTIKVPSPQETALNTELRVPHEGMPKLGQGTFSKKRGDLVITFEIKVPKKISVKAKKLLDDLREEIED
ncbi:MAG: molecular chaperone DnaJ [Candidatus Harrisonbacteria bacterium]|nr:molecular chaperone DnaJ [Candidatus Harrisonbacteria bacterium]